MNSDGYFFVAFWTDFSAGPAFCILDWYTILTGIASAAILALHGANYLAMKTEGELYRRAVVAAKLVGWLALVATLVFRRQQRDISALVASNLFIAAMLGSIAWGCYPNVLIATTEPACSLTTYNATGRSS